MNKQQLRTLYWISFVLAALSLAVLVIIDEKLKGPDVPLGIVSFELCAYTANCAAMVSSWQGSLQAMAGMSLGFDYLFMLAYPAAICFGLLIYKVALPSPMQRVANAMAGAVWLAGLADAVENYHLFQMLMGQAVDQHAWPATLAATIKFVILLPALVLWIVSGIGYFLGKNKSSNA
jgi:hypothetical protein